MITDLLDELHGDVSRRPGDGRPGVVTAFLAPGRALVPPGQFVQTAGDIKTAVRAEEEILTQLVLTAGLAGQGPQVLTVPTVSRHTDQVGGTGLVVVTTNGLPQHQQTSILVGRSDTTYFLSRQIPVWTFLLSGCLQQVPSSPRPPSSSSNPTQSEVRRQCLKPVSLLRQG